MGLFKQKVRVSNLKNNSLSFEKDFWVDTGALYSLIPMNFLEEIGFEPVSTRNLMFANGKVDTRLFGLCNFEIEGINEKIPCPVVAGNNDSLFLLGATALENFGVEADPINKRLNSVLAIIAGFRELM